MERYANIVIASKRQTTLSHMSQLGLKDPTNRTPTPSEAIAAPISQIVENDAIDALKAKAGNKKAESGLSIVIAYQRKQDEIPRLH